MLHGSRRRPFVKLDSEVDEALAASESQFFLSRQRPIVESHLKVSWGMKTRDMTGPWANWVGLNRHT
jgi:hypothetical protein